MGTRSVVPAHIQIREDQALGAAWRRCNEALPDGWRMVELSSGEPDSVEDENSSIWWFAYASPLDPGIVPGMEGLSGLGLGLEDYGTHEDGHGATPAEALDDLRAKLEALHD